MKERLLRHAPSARTALLVPALCVAAYWFVREVDGHYPIEHWMFWVYAKLWGWCALFTVACASTGHLIGCAIGAKTLPLAERTIVTLACGVLAFFVLMFLGGIAGAYGPVFAVLLPVAMTAAGALPLVRSGRRAFRHLRRARRAASRPAWWFYPALAFGLLGVGMVYFAILSPRNIAFDSHFYHLGLAQQYAVQGGIGPSVEGWMPAAIPHLASVLYTWTFILPGQDMFDRITGAAHLEMVLFLFTLASIPVLVRWLVPRARAGVSWAALFLFPGIHVYDSTLSVAADHINAFWAIPIFLTLRRALGTLRATTGANLGRAQRLRLVRDFGLLTAMLSGAILTKYQAMYLLPFPMLAVAGVMAWRLGHAALLRRSELAATAKACGWALGAAVGAGLLLTAPHWLKNWAWFGDPLFPYLNRFFASPRWVPDVGPLFEGWNATQTKSWTTQGDTGERLHETLKQLVFFSFEPHDWPKFHGKVPVFGSLFTLSLLVLPFVRGAKRTWALVVAAHLGIFVWFWTMHQDRYLQTLLPWMACVVAATIALCWRAHWAVKPFVCAWIGLQAIWGGDAYFIPSHAMTGTAPPRVSMDLLSAGYAKKYDERFEVPGQLFAIGRDPALPPDATVLLHEHNPRLGIWRPVVMDIAGWVYGMRYERFESPAALHARLREYGVTHVLARHHKSRGFDSLGADLQFFAFVEIDALPLKRFGEWSLYEVPVTPPRRTSNGVVAYLGCGKQYERGLHDLASLSVREKQVAKQPPRAPAKVPAPGSAAALGELLERADYAVTGSGCTPAAPPAALEPFVKIGVRGKEQLWARRQSGS